MSLPAASEPAVTDGPHGDRPKSRIFDIPIDLGQPNELLRMVTGWVGTGQRRRVMYVNAHVLNQSRAILIKVEPDFGHRGGPHAAGRRGGPSPRNTSTPSR